MFSKKESIISTFSRLLLDAPPPDTCSLMMAPQELKDFCLKLNNFSRRQGKSKCNTDKLLNMGRTCARAFTLLVSHLGFIFLMTQHSSHVSFIFHKPHPLWMCLSILASKFPWPFTVKMKQTKTLTSRSLKSSKFT